MSKKRRKGKGQGEARDPWQMTVHHRKPKDIGGEKSHQKNKADVPHIIHETWNRVQGTMCATCFENRFVPYALENGYEAEFFRKKKPLHDQLCDRRQCPLRNGTQFTPEQRAALQELKELVAHFQRREQTFFGLGKYISDRLLDADELIKLHLIVKPFVRRPPK
jgi:hypothetical protein